MRVSRELGPQRQQQLARLLELAAFAKLDGAIKCRPILGGLINEYERAA